jgi:hypothetical protein
MERSRALLLALLAGCAAGGRSYHDKAMDFASIRTVAVLPFENLTTTNTAHERVRDVFSNMLLATGALYVLPAGEVQRAIGRVGVSNPALPSKEEVVGLGKALAAEAVVTGVLKEYGEVRSGNSAGNVIALSVQMIETQTGKVVWSAATSKGGIGVGDRLLGGGGEPMNDVTEDAVRDLLAKLFH